MNQPFSSNPFASLLPAETAASIADGAGGCRLFAFEFEPGGGALPFAEHLGHVLSERGRLSFRADLRMATGDEHLVKLLARSFVQAFAGDLGRIEGALKRLIPTATPHLIMDENPHVDIDYGTEPHKVFGGLVDLPELMAEKEGRPTAVVWSGFGRVEEVLGEQGLRLFADRMRKQKMTSHIIAGFGAAGIAQKLGGGAPDMVRIVYAAELMPQGVLEAFLAGSFAGEDAPLKPATAAAIAGMADGKLETALSIARACAPYCGKMPDEDAVGRAVDDILAGAAAAYEQIWELLNPRQRGVLYGFTHGGERNIYSEGFIREFGFKTATNLQAAIRGLDTKGILHKRGKRWIFSDPLFALWIKRFGR